MKLHVIEEKKPGKVGGVFESEAAAKNAVKSLVSEGAINLQNIDLVEPRDRSLENKVEPVNLRPRLVEILSEDRELRNDARHRAVSIQRPCSLEHFSEPLVCYFSRHRPPDPRIRELPAEFRHSGRVAVALL